MNVSKIKLSAGNLVISGTISEAGYAYTCFASPLQPYEMNISEDGDFELSVTVEKYKGSLFVNIRALLTDTASLEMLGGHVNGFLILCSDNKRNPLEVNMLARELLRKFMGETPYI